MGNQSTGPCNVCPLTNKEEVPIFGHKISQAIIDLILRICAYDLGGIMVTLLYWSHICGHQFQVVCYVVHWY